MLKALYCLRAIYVSCMNAALLDLLNCLQALLQLLLGPRNLLLSSLSASHHYICELKRDIVPAREKEHASALRRNTLALTLCCKQGPFHQGERRQMETEEHVSDPSQRPEWVQVACFSVCQVACISVSQVACISVSQVACFSVRQVAYVSVSQVACISVSQVACIFGDDMCG